MNRKHDRSFAQVENDVASAFRGGDAASSVAAATARGLSGPARDDEDLPEIVSALAESVARGTVKGGGEFAVSAEGFLIGAARGAAKNERSVLALIEYAAASFMSRALDEGADPGLVAKGLVEGASAGARESGSGDGMAVSRAEQGAVDAADRAGPEAGRKVREALNGRDPGGPIAQAEPAGSPGEGQRERARSEVQAAERARRR